MASNLGAFVGFGHGAFVDGGLGARGRPVGNGVFIFAPNDLMDPEFASALQSQNAALADVLRDGFGYEVTLWTSSYRAAPRQLSYYSQFGTIVTALIGNISPVTLPWWFPVTRNTPGSERWTGRVVLTGEWAQRHLAFNPFDWANDFINHPALVNQTGVEIGGHIEYEHIADVNSSSPGEIQKGQAQTTASGYRAGTGFTIQTLTSGVTFIQHDRSNVLTLRPDLVDQLRLGATPLALSFETVPSAVAASFPNTYMEHPTRILSGARGIVATNRLTWGQTAGGLKVDPIEWIVFADSNMAWGSVVSSFESIYTVPEAMEINRRFITNLVERPLPSEWYP